MNLGASGLKSLLGLLLAALAPAAAEQVRKPLRKILTERYSAAGRHALGRHLESAGLALQQDNVDGAASSLSEAVGDFKL
jgi:hypothetical protein